ncbi:MAG: radical SAM protein [Oscillospiraceae bacterium]|jgi:MoaA/NifB/PqqE/SkfB family radical SAM enzyme|nr:radical SAM protein [Oscillospiraceae bacterium]
MANQYINLNRIEFSITDACSGRCKHCGDGGRSAKGASVRMDAAVDAVRKLANRFPVESVMTFGGEPLLFADTVCAIHAAARDCGIPKRQLITNGYFSKDEKRIDAVAEKLCNAGVNDIMLSVDAFHQEYIPLEPVMAFAEAQLRHKAPQLRVHPAWVVNERYENPYNAETKRILKQFQDKGIAASRGNNIGPSGNAVKYLGEYFAPPEEIDLTAPCGSMPYTTRLDAIDCFCINPNGDVRLCSVSIGNIYKCDILELVDSYNPNTNPATRAVMADGAGGLLRYAQAQGITLDLSDCRSACGICRKVMAALPGENVKLPQ